jgi:hypothetical protein
MAKAYFEGINLVIEYEKGENEEELRRAIEALGFDMGPSDYQDEDSHPIGFAILSKGLDR